MSTFFRTAILGTIALAASAAASQAFEIHNVVSSYGVEKQLELAYGDLNLASEAGAGEFLSRLRNAARQVCGGEPYIGDLERRAFYNRCMSETMDRTVAKVSAPLVAQIYYNNVPVGKEVQAGPTLADSTPVGDAGSMP